MELQTTDVIIIHPIYIENMCRLNTLNVFIGISPEIQADKSYETPRIFLSMNQMKLFSYSTASYLCIFLTCYANKICRDSVIGSDLCQCVIKIPNEEYCIDEDCINRINCSLLMSNTVSDRKVTIRIPYVTARNQILEFVSLSSKLVSNLNSDAGPLATNASSIFCSNCKHILMSKPLSFQEAPSGFFDGVMKSFLLHIFF
jgi:hypothetical protein